MTKRMVGYSAERGGSTELEEGWAICEKCSVKLKDRNMDLHMEKVHGTKNKEDRPAPASIIPLILALGLVTLIIAAGIYYGFFRKDDEGSDNGGIDIPDSDWLDSYSPKNRISVYDEDWWISYPRQNPSSEGQVNHPSWVTERIKDRPILVFAHSDNCAPCNQQKESISAMMEVYGNDILLFDLLSGSDVRATEAFEAYDPNGSPNYIPLTAIITLADDNEGTVRIAWHSIEGATGDEWLDNYVKDAIYYHHRNADRWS